MPKKTRKKDEDEMMEGVGEGLNLEEGDDVPDIPDQPPDKLPPSPDYSKLYTKVKVEKSGGKPVQMIWQGRTLTTEDLRKLYDH